MLLIPSSLSQTFPEGNLYESREIVIYPKYGLNSLATSSRFSDILLFSMSRCGSRAAATSKMECFVITFNGFQPLSIITKHSILDAAAALDPSLMSIFLESPRTCLLEKYDLKISQKCLQLSESKTSLRYSGFV